MEFVGKKCHLCGEEFGNRKPESATTVEPFPFGERRIVSVVAPCPSCGKDVPVWEPGPGPEPEPEAEPEPTEPEPEPET